MTKKAEINRTVTIRLLIGASIALIGLGVGNILVADYKIGEIAKQLQRAKQDLMQTPEVAPKAIESDPDDLTVFKTAPTRESQREYIKRLQARTEFYELVIRGGKCFLAVSGVLLLALLVLMNPRAPELES